MLADGRRPLRRDRGRRGRSRRSTARSTGASTASTRRRRTAPGTPRRSSARALAGRRKDVILVTKCGVKAPPAGPARTAARREPGQHPAARSTRASTRLRTDWVDVLLVHWPDAGPRSRTRCARLEEVVASGRVRFVGVSNFTRRHAGRVHAHAAGRRAPGRLPHVRPPPGAGDLPACLENGIGVMGYGSLGHGLLTGAFTADHDVRPRARLAGHGVAFGQPIFRGDNFKTQPRGGRAPPPRGGRAARGRR